MVLSKPKIYNTLVVMDKKLRKSDKKMGWLNSFEFYYILLSEIQNRYLPTSCCLIHLPTANCVLL